MTLFLLGLSLALTATAQREARTVTVRITQEGEAARTWLDTTFTVGPDLSVDSILDRLDADPRWQDQPTRKLVIIQDLDRRADVARSQPEDAAPQPMLGVYLESDHEAQPGVRVTDTFGAARAAGIQAHDRIVAIDAAVVDRIEDISQAKVSKQVGEVLRVEVLREGTRQTFAVELGGPSDQNVAAEPDHPREKGFLGVYTDEVDAQIARQQRLSSQLGTYIRDVVPHSGAARAGLQAGDVITHIEGQELDAGWELGEALADFAPGEKVMVGYRRKGEPALATVALTERIGHQPRPTRWKQVKREEGYLGVHLDAHDQAVRIAQIVSGEAAEAADLRVGDRIVAIDRDEVDTYGELAERIQRQAPGTKVKLTVMRGGKKEKVKAVLGSRVRHHWVSLPVEAEAPNDELLGDMDDPEQAEAFRQQMEAPDLDMADFEFFPNPNPGQFRLRFTLPEQGDTDIRVFSTQGKEVFRERLRNFSGRFDERIDLGDGLPDGIYFLQITRNGRGMVERLILQQ